MLRVFITSDEAPAVKNVADKLGITDKEAARKISRVNTGRANHYWHYTGRQWSDMRDYDLMINAGKIGTEASVNMILRAGRQME